MQSLIIYMLKIASCKFPFHQAILLQHWMVYNHAWPLSSHGCRQINRNWIPPHWEWTATEQISFYVFNRAFGCWKLPRKICSQSWSDLRQKLQLPLTYICKGVVHVNYHIPDLLRICRHLDLDSAKLLANALVSSRLDYCNSFCLGLQKLTSPSPNVFWTVWLVWSQSHHHLLAVFHCCAPFIGYQ